MRKIEANERRARLGLRHHLARPAATVETVAADIVGLHSSDPATVFLSAWARVRDFAVPDLEQALYERRSLVRMLGMRRTMFVVPPEVAAVMDAACTRALALPERKRLIRLLEDQVITDDAAAWLNRVQQSTLDALDARGEATAGELVAAVPELGLKLSFGEGTTWAGTVGLSTRVLFLLATEGRIVRARPRGTWLSSQYRWAPTAAWLDGPLREVDPAAGRADLAQRWLRTFGPGTLNDIQWWSGWSVRHTRSALEEAEAVEVELDEGTGYVLPDDVERALAAEPWAALLPGLDPTVMGWKERGWYLADHQSRLFDRNGNAGPTVWWDGRIVGGWGQRHDGEVVVELLEDVGAEAVAAITTEAARLQAWLGGVRVTPRFRTPLEKELSAR